MKITNPFFAIGTFGMIITAALHIVFAVIIAKSSVHSAFIVLYPVFMSFLVIGFGQILKSHKTQLVKVE
jgi:hypothetical protein